MPGPRRIGVLGGTFDPPHVAHLVTALDAADQLDLDLVLLVVANDPWQKTDVAAITPAATRLRMVAAAVADLDGVEASDIEIVRGGRTYTADTLAALAERWPGAELFLVLGSDAAAGLATWDRPDEVVARCQLAVVERPGAAVRLPELGSGVPPAHVIASASLDLSSSELRARVAAGRSLRYLVPDGVADVIARESLYRTTADRRPEHRGRGLYGEPR